MTAKEVREYRNISKKLVEAEERGKLLKNLLRQKVCLKEEEVFIEGSDNKFRILGNKKGILKKKHEEFVKVNLKYKIKDNQLYGVKLRRRRDWLRRGIEDTMGSRSSGCRSLVSDVKKNCVELRGRLRMKNKKKINHLVRKYGSKDDSGWSELSDDVKEMMGRPRIFAEDDTVTGEVLRDAVVVEREGEIIVLSEDEKEFLRLRP